MICSFEGLHWRPFKWRRMWLRKWRNREKTWLFEEQEGDIEEDEVDFEGIKEGEETIEGEAKIEGTQEDKSSGEERGLKVKLFLSFLVLFVLARILLLNILERDLKSFSQNFEHFFHFLSLNYNSKLFIVYSITYTDLQFLS